MEYVGKLYGRIGGKYIEVADTEKLREQNAALRAAVAEMQRMLPVLEFLEHWKQNTWDDMVENNKDLSSIEIDAYRQTLATALAKIESK